MRDVLDDDLAELYSVRPADDVRLARLRAQLFTEKPKRRSTRWVGIAAAAAAVVLIAGLVVFLRPAGRDTAATMPHAPATSLAEAATLLELTEKPAAKYRHIRYLVWQTMAVTTGPTFSAAALEYEINVWLPVAPGQMVVIYRDFTGGRRHIAGAEWSMDDLKPADGFRGPVLWGSFCAATPCHEESLKLPLRVGQKLEDASSALLSPFTTTEEKAGLYRRLGESQEIRWDNGTVSSEGASVQYTVDPATGEVSGFEERRPTRENRLPAGVVTMSGTVTYEWTDQRPS